MAERFPPAVADVLDDAGWTPDRSVDCAGAIDAVERITGRSGARTRCFPAAERVLREFAGVVVMQDGPGVDVRRKPFALDPTCVAATADTLADFGAVLGVALFPIGMEGEFDSILAVAEDGRVYAIDHTGEWLLGDTVEAALVTLITGILPTRV